MHIVCSTRKISLDMEMICPYPKNGRKWRNTDARSYKHHGVEVKDVLRGGTKRSVDATAGVSRPYTTHTLRMILSMLSAHSMGEPFFAKRMFSQRTPEEMRSGLSSLYSAPVQSPTI